MKREVGIAEQRAFLVFRTIKLGNIRFGTMFHGALFDWGFRIHDCAREFLEAMSFGPAENELDLVAISVADLGFDRGARCDAVYSRAQELGLELCPAEVGPQLRLQYRDQPFNEVLHIAMEPFIASPFDDLGATSVVLSVDSLGVHGKMLGVRLGGCDYYASGGDRWVFVQSRR